MEAKQLNLNGAHIIGARQALSDDERMLQILTMVSTFRMSVKMAIDEVGEILKEVSLDPYASEALHAYKKMLEEGYKLVRKQQAEMLLKASKTFLKVTQSNMEKVREVMDSLPKE